MKNSFKVIPVITHGMKGVNVPIYSLCGLNSHKLGLGPGGHSPNYCTNCSVLTTVYSRLPAEMGPAGTANDRSRG